MKNKSIYTIIIAVLILWNFSSCSKSDQHFHLSTDYLKVGLTPSGYFDEFVNISKNPNVNHINPEKPSPVLSLYNPAIKKYYYPVKCEFQQNENLLSLDFENGSTAKIKVEPKAKYIRLELLELSNRQEIGAIQWGPYHTNINNLLGEIIGVARDTSKAVNYAIGMLALDDNTNGGTCNIEGDAAPFQYIIHSPDPEKYPLPDHLHEGQVFTIGGDGISDVAFYSYKDPWYRIMYGNAAMVDSTGQIELNYFSRDRTKKRKVFYSLIPNMETNKPNHIEVEPIQGVDYIGSSIALWGSPDDIALQEVIQEIVLEEGLPYPTINRKWIKDPTAYVPDAITSGGLYDSIISYTTQLGFKTISLYDQGFIRPDRGNEGYIDGKDFSRKSIRLTSGNVSHKEFSEMAAKHGIIIGRTPITNSLAPGTKDASPVPSDSLCYQVKRILTKDIGPEDTMIFVNDPTHLEEIASWEGHCENLNMVKIGKELIHYLGVSETEPYRLLNVKRGYWGTEQASHTANDTIYKLQVTINYGYDGLIPNLALQDLIAEYYAEVCKINGLGYYDFDGQEFLFNNGHGYYSAKRFFRKMFEKADEYGLPHIRFTGATLSEGSWHYQSIWNVGGGTNMYDAKTREWGSSTSQGKDLRDVTYANYFPRSMGMNFPVNKNSTVEEYEHIQAVAVGIGATYSLKLNQKDVESCPQKDRIFKVIRTWEDARAANAFPASVKQKLVNPDRSWRLEAGDNPDTWMLFEMKDGEKGKPIQLVRAEGY